MDRSITTSALAVLLPLLLACAGCGPQKRADPTEAVFADFAKRVDEYVKLRNQVADSVGVLDETMSQDQIAARAVKLGQGITALRADVEPGSIFTTEAATIIATLIREEYRRRPPPVLESREDAQEELADFEPKVNMIYPTTYPLATFPATLLPLLPQLPEEVEYRIVTHYLILRDTEANLIVDFMPKAVP